MVQQHTPAKCQSGHGAAKLARLPITRQTPELSMILELADLRIQPGQHAAFEEAIQRGLSTVIQQAKGFQGYKVNKGIENPERYILQIFWDTLEDHTVGFRESPAFTEWRAIVGPFFAAPPVVEHFDLLTKSA
jgi:heme-degrading monooxygenase HmoA